jgi:hypothetical protein
MKEPRMHSVTRSVLNRQALSRAADCLRGRMQVEQEPGCKTRKPDGKQIVIVHRAGAWTWQATNPMLGSSSDVLCFLPLLTRLDRSATEQADSSDNLHDFCSVGVRFEFPPDWGFSRLFSVPPRKYLDSTSSSAKTTSFHTYLPN